MDFWEIFKRTIADIKAYIPAAVVLLILWPIIYFEGRKSKHKPKDEEKKKQNNS